MEVDSDSLKSLVACWVRDWDSKIGDDREQPQGITLRPGRLGIGAKPVADRSDASLHTTIARNLRQQYRIKKARFDTDHTIDDKAVEEGEEDSRYTAVAKLRGGSRTTSVHTTTDDEHNRKRRRKRKRKTAHSEDNIGRKKDGRDENVDSRGRGKDAEEKKTYLDRIVEEQQVCGNVATVSGNNAKSVCGDCKLSSSWRQGRWCLLLSARHPLRWKCVQCRKIKMGCLSHRWFPAYLY
ncbi:uncharacterized protein LOC134180436 [Corticium candelabrum]|uniref:uncharacterized protein LOC134180436 n=1 Tax=Corticium candelabrum TaxID=121492 RepID=UPI002E261E4A|nr:uncharacterized protein LOC134180436 [Corticium candelabrum]